MLRTFIGVATLLALVPGSVLAAAASSSINDSRANEFPVAASARYEPCRNGGREFTESDFFFATSYGHSID